MGAGLLALAVGLGAFGAHGLRGRLDEYAMGVYEKAVFYHFVHALGILVVGVAGGEGGAGWGDGLCGFVGGGEFVGGGLAAGGGAGGDVDGAGWGAAGAVECGAE